MKKIIALFAVAALGAALIGCGSSESTTETPAAGTTSGTSAAPAAGTTEAPAAESK